MVPKIVAAVVAALACVAASGLADTDTVTGVLVDRVCYTKDKANTTVAHKGMGDACAQECAKKGQPLALVTSTGELFTVVGDLAANKNEKLIPHLSHTVTLTGDVTGDTVNVRKTIWASELKMVSK
jgi:hypothetical protein